MLAREGVAIASVLAAFAIVQQPATLLQQLQHQTTYDDDEEEYDLIQTPKTPKVPTNLSCRVGIASGQAICAIVGSNLRREYIVVGKVVENARDLTNDVLPGLLGGQDVVATDATIRCDADTRFASMNQFRFNKIGKDIFEPVGKSDSSAVLRREPSLSEKLVGRGAEMLVLRDRIESLLNTGKGGLVMIEGEPGIGKSRLLREFCWMCTTESQIFLDGCADMNDRVTPYLGWRRVFSQMFRFNLLSKARTESDSYRSMSSSDSDTNIEKAYVF